MATWTPVAGLASEQEDAELRGVNVDSDAFNLLEDADRPRPRPRWTTPTIILGAACGLLAALGAAAAFYAPWAPSAGQSQGAGIGGDAHVTVLTDDEGAARAGPGMLHVADLSTFESKAAAGASCQIPCGSGDGTCSSVLAGLLDETTDSMPPGSDPSCGNAQELVKQQCPLCNCCGDMCAVTLGVQLGAAPCANPYEVSIELFDLNMSHPDFEQPFVSNLCKGLVDEHLAPDFTPVLSANAGSLPGDCARAIKDQNSFNDWYHDTAKSFPESGTLRLCQNPNTGYYEYENHAYFTMDGRGWDERKQGAPDHNYHFTMHMHNYFTMEGGETFTFQGDDDVWVFFSKCIKGTDKCRPSQLGIDLGGVHTVREQTVNLEKKLGLKPGDYVRMDFFWAERHTTESNLKIVTNINFDTETTTTSRTSTSRTFTSRTSTTRTSTTKTTTSGTTTTNTETHTTLTNTVTTTTATTTTATTTTVTTTTTATTTSVTTTSVTTTSITATTTTATTITATTTTPSATVPVPVPTTSILPTTPNPCEDGCDGKTCAVKLEEILNESGEGSSPPITLPEAVLVLLKMCPNCESCDPSGICPQVVGSR